MCFPPYLVRPGRRLPVQGLSEGSLGYRDRLPAWRGPGTGLGRSQTVCLFSCPIFPCMFREFFQSENVHALFPTQKRTVGTDLNEKKKFTNISSEDQDLSHGLAHQWASGRWGRGGQRRGVRWSALGSQAKLSPDAASFGRGPLGPGPLVPPAARSCHRQPQKFLSFWFLSIRGLGVPGTEDFFRLRSAVVQSIATGIECGRDCKTSPYKFCTGLSIKLYPQKIGNTDPVRETRSWYNLIGEVVQSLYCLIFEQSSPSILSTVVP